MGTKGSQFSSALHSLSAFHLNVFIQTVFVKVQGCPAGQNPLILLLSLIFDVTVVTVSHHLVFELLLYSDR